MVGEFTRSMARICEMISEQPRIFLDVAVILQRREWDNILDGWKPYEQEESETRANVAANDAVLDEERNILEGEKHWDNSYAEQMQRPLPPLRMIRKVPKVKVRHAKEADLSPVLIRKFEPRYPEDNHLAEAILELRNLLQSSKKPERLFKIFENILSYAQSFERNEHFSVDMLPFIWYKGVRKHKRKYDRNPYLKERQNVEEYLINAALAAEDLRNMDFYSPRQMTLDYLEPQYGRMAAGCRTLQELVNDLKLISTGFYITAPLWWHYTWQLQALEELEWQTAAFERDWKKKFMLLLQFNEVYQTHFSASTLGTAMRDMESALASINAESQLPGHDTESKITPTEYKRYEKLFIVALKTAVNDLVDWFMRIREARQSCLSTMSMNRHARLISPLIRMLLPSTGPIGCLTGKSGSRLI